LQHVIPDFPEKQRFRRYFRNTGASPVGRSSIISLADKLNKNRQMALRSSGLFDILLPEKFSPAVQG